MTLARPWAPPGVPGLEHRIGGLEKADGSGNVSYDPVNHEHMVQLRAAKVAGIVDDIAPAEVDDETGDAEVLVLGWGSTFGAIAAGVRRVRARGLQGGPRPPEPPQPVPGQPGRGAPPLPPGAGPRGEPGPAQPDGAGRVPGGRPVDDQDAGRALPGRRDRVGHPGPDGRRSAGPGRRKSTHHDHHRHPRDDPQGLDQRPGGPLVPGLRRLLDPGRRADAHARPRRAPREHGVPLGHRLRRPLPVLHVHLRHALDPRAGPGHRHRPGRDPARPRRLGGHRRRGRPVDRRQPPDPRPAAQRATSPSSCSTTRSTA